MFNFLPDVLKATVVSSEYEGIPGSEGESESPATESVPRCKKRLRNNWTFQKVTNWILVATSLLAVFTLFWFSWPEARVREFAPEARAVLVKFKPDRRFMSVPSSESDAAWDALIPQGRGFVLVESPDAFNLDRGIPTEAGLDRYSVSMFHQLHCLAALRNGYYALLNQEDPFITDGERLTAKQRKVSHSEHMGHCFDYLRQSIMCAGDSTLEWAQKSPDGSVLPTVDGWGITHQCRSWDDLVAWTLEHHAPQNRSGIL